MNPSLGRNFEALDPLEWLARTSDHIPDPGQHRTILYRHYAPLEGDSPVVDRASATATCD